MAETTVHVPGAAMGETVMRAVDITKAYRATHALKGVDFEIKRGRVTVLLGENGAGKSTLMKIMAGVEQPTSGHLELDGQVVEFDSPSAAVDRGVAIIHQELNLCTNLSVSDNIFIGREVTKSGLVQQGAQRARTREILERLHEQIDPRTLVGDLSIGKQQLVEIARALAEDARVLIMDEPTSALSASEVEMLFSVIRDLTATGVSIVYISHHLDECLEIGDDAVVLRDGRVVGQAPFSEIDMGWIVTKMVGREEGGLFTTIDAEPGEVVLQVRDAVVADSRNPHRMAVNGVTLDVRAGEIVGIYGLMGAGRTELLETIAGRNPLLQGSIELSGQNLGRSSIAQRIENGLILVPEDRQKDGLVRGISIRENLSLASLGRFTKGFVLNRRSENELARGVMTDVRVKASSPEALPTSLSGGNQQKVVLGKALMTQPKVLLLDEPTRGIDVGAKADVFALMAAKAAEGLGVLFASSEIAEVINSSTRILVMSRGRITAELDPKTTNREEILAAADLSAAPENVATPEDIATLEEGA